MTSFPYPPDPRPLGPSLPASTLPLERVWRPIGEFRNHRLVQVSSIDVAPAGWAAQRCADGHFLPDSFPTTSPMWTVCRCGSPRHDDSFAVRFSSTELLISTTHAESAIWWHLSDAGDVFVNARNDPMHWGELDTVLHYYATESLMPAWSTSQRPRYLYAANLLPGVTVNPTAFIENQSVDEHVEILAAAASQGPTRYLNTREVPGSVSLVALKTDFNPIHCIDLWNQVTNGITLPSPPPEET